MEATILENLTIPKIIQTFDKNTTLKARCLLSDYSEMTIQGKVSDVEANELMMPGIVQLTIKPMDAPEHRPFLVTADFNVVLKDELYQQLINLRKNQTIKISGRIDYITPNVLSLKDAEIIENENQNAKINHTRNNYN